MKVVVTGGAGFIGANVCAAMTQTGQIDEIVALDDLSTGSLDNLAGLDIEFVEGSILDPELLDEVLDGADGVVHLAARPSVPRSIADPAASHEVNVTGTMNVLEAARRSDNAYVVVASSSSVYGANPELPKHEGLTPRPMSPYAATKLAAESYTLAWQASYGLPTLAFRFFNVFGPLQAAGHAYAAVIPAFLDAAVAGRPLPVNGDGSQSRDFTYVETVSAVLIDAVVRKVVDPVPVNLAFGTRTSLLEIAAKIEELVGHPLEIEHRDPRVGDVPHSQAANDRLRSLFPDIVPVELHRGLGATLSWFVGGQ